MNRILALAAALAAFGTANAVVITFDDLQGDNNPVPSGYAGFKTWDWTYYNFAQPPYNPHSGTCRVYSVSDGLIDVGHDIIFRGAWFNGYGSANGFGPVSFDMYRQGQLVAQSGKLDLDASGNATFLASGYNGAVDRINVRGPYGFFVMDDVTYDVVPEPATIAVLGVGLAALARRRRK